MQPTSILFPVLVQVGLTYAVLVALGPARSRSMHENKQQLTDDDVRLGRNAWSEQATKVANNYRNQLELPVLFYAVVAFALITSGVDLVMLVLAWVFALSRIVHAALHIGPNIVMLRGLAFLVGAAALLAMWAKLALHIL
ncbi:MAG: MAPEG family protein [Hyphomicrobiaceae bacterium]